MSSASRFVELHRLPKITDTLSIGRTDAVSERRRDIAAAPSI
jgi:hypothetical protein